MDSKKEEQDLVVGCSKCKTRLKIADEKVTPEGIRIKCPKCMTILMVKKPVAADVKKAIDPGTVMIAHHNQESIDKIKSILEKNGYTVTAALDGVEAMIKASKDLPFMAIIDVSLPRIYGFEVCKRLKERPETKDIKIIILASIYDKTKYRRQPASLHGADEYIEEHDIDEFLIEKINLLKGVHEEKPAAPSPIPEKMPEKPSVMPETAVPGKPAEKFEKSEPAAPKPLSQTTGAKEPAAYVQAPPQPVSQASDEIIFKAQRLVRTIIADIYLYNPAKMEASIKNNNFYDVFATELREGQKLYEARIPPDLRKKGDYFKDTIDKFIEDKKKTLNL